MSGLGSTVDPAGAPGSGTNNAAEQAETIRDNPGTIIQSTAIQTLSQLLNDNWIYDSTFTVSTNMPAGTIAFVKPIHPAQWNWPNRRVSGMFNLWTGSGKIRYRPLATAWYGGSIRVGFLPPNINVSGVRQLPLEVLTSYPNRDIDPKNTDWVSFRGPDQREFAYHYMKPFDSNDRTSFGGYIVFYVAGKLVTQAPDFTTIQFVVESAGDFMYDQPNPLALDDPIAKQDPVGGAAAVPLHLQPLCDSLYCGDFTGMQVCKSTVVTLKEPGIGCSAVGKGNLHGVPGWTLGTSYDDNKEKFRIPFHSWAFNNSDPSVFSPRPTLRPNWSQETDGIAAGGASAATEATWFTVNVGGSALNTLQMAPHTNAGGILPNGATYLTLQEERDNNGPIDFSKVAVGSGTTVAPQATGESIVIWTHLATGVYSAQTENIAESLAAWPTPDFDAVDSWLYELLNSQGTPLLTIRLNPNGVFTTNASATDVLYPTKGARLRYFGTLPISSPLPPLTGSQRSLSYDLRRVARDTGDHMSEAAHEIVQNF